MGEKHDRSYRYALRENETKFPWPIKLGTVCDKNQIGKWRDRSYRYVLYLRRNCTIVTYNIGLVYAKNEIQLPWLIGQGTVYEKN